MASSSSVGITSTVVGDLSAEIAACAFGGAGVEVLVEFDAERRHAGERVAAHGGVVLAHPGGERDDVGVAEQRQVGADVLAQPVDVHVVGQLRCRVTGFDALVQHPEVDLAAEARARRRAG